MSDSEIRSKIEQNKKTIKQDALFIAGLFLCGIVLLFIFPESLHWGIFVLLIAVGLSYQIGKEISEKSKENATLIIKAKARFLEQCQKNGYTDMSDPNQSLKAKVIATDLGLNYGRNIKSFYEQAALDCQQETRETERLAVNGDLLLSLKSSCDCIAVFVRPDCSVYCTCNDGNKIEGTPKISVEKGGVFTYDYVPSQAVYTGATVGGVSTGGIHYTKAGYNEKYSKTNTGYIEATAGDTTITVSDVVVSPFTAEKFRRSDEFQHLVSGNEIKCMKFGNSEGRFYADLMVKSSNYAMKTQYGSMAAEKSRLPYSDCVRIATLINTIISLNYPPSDESIYEEACRLEQSEKSEDLQHAMDLFTLISDYKDSGERKNGLYEKYERILQNEKEQAILNKEKRRFLK